MFPYQVLWMGIIRDLFDNLIQSSEILNIDPLFRDTLIAKRKLLIPYQIGSKNQLQEWFKDYESPDPHHRHVSHLYSVFPAHLISLQQTPELAAAAKKSLILRGDESTGWSLAWKVNLWARLQDGNHAYRLYRDLLRITKENGYDYNEGGGLYANMFDAHPPFQIDGNFGGASGLIEMLLQSQDGNVHLLPALPDAWASGSFNGLVARGNFVIDLSWDHKKVEHATVYARRGGVCKILSSSPLMIEKTKIMAVKKSNGFELVFNTHKNSYYQLTSVK
jgi:alpha-L-fucosidase 2